MNLSVLSMIFVIIMLKSVTAMRPCSVNVCFALSSRAPFAAQKNVVAGAVWRMYSRQGFKTVSAVQYGAAVSKVSDKTSSRADFLRDLWAARLTPPQAEFVAGGINYCFGRLRRSGRGGVIVVLGKGTRGIGADPVLRAQLFRRLGGRVFFVGVGYPLKWPRMYKIAGSWERVLSVSGGKVPWNVGQQLADRIC